MNQVHDPSHHELPVTCWLQLLTSVLKLLGSIIYSRQIVEHYVHTQIRLLTCPMGNFQNQFANMKKKKKE